MFFKIMLIDITSVYVTCSKAGIHCDSKKERAEYMYTEG